MNWAIEMALMPGYFLAGEDSQWLTFVKPDAPTMRRFESREQAESALAALPRTVRKDARVSELCKEGGKP